MHRCAQCKCEWQDDLAARNQFHCIVDCGGQLVPIPPVDSEGLKEIDLDRLCYPVALTAKRLANAVTSSADSLRTLVVMKDCFEATVKYLSILLLTDFLRSSSATSSLRSKLLERMVHPSLGGWVDGVLYNLSRWLVSLDTPLAKEISHQFVHPPAAPGGKVKQTELFLRCKKFVTYRNDTLGHGALRTEETYQSELKDWLPLIHELLSVCCELDAWKLCLVNKVNGCERWMGTILPSSSEPGQFSADQVGKFVLCGPDGTRDLYPFICYLSDSGQDCQLHYYDSIYCYSPKATVRTMVKGRRWILLPTVFSTQGRTISPPQSPGAVRAPGD